MSAQAALPLTPAAAPAPAATPAASAPAPAAAEAPAKKEESTPAPSTEGILGATGEAKKQQDGGTQAQDGEQPKPAGELEIKLPEGMEADPVVLKEFQEVAKKHGISAEQASNLLAWDYERTKSAMAAQAAERQAQQDTWAKELGTKYGAKIEEAGMHARRAIRAYGGEPLAKFFAESGLSNHPVLVETFRAIGAALGEDDSAVTSSGDAASSDPQAQLRKLYPSMFNEDGSPKK